MEPQPSRNRESLREKTGWSTVSFSARTPISPPDLPDLPWCDNVHMAWIDTIPEGEAQGELRRGYDDAVERAGKVWNIVKLMSLTPPTMRASMGLYLASVHGPSPLTRVQREMLAVVVSKVNNCHY